MADLGKEALNKVAEVGISSQLDEVEELDVNVETDPLKLASGNVDAVAIHGEGMVMQGDLRVEEMTLNTGKIAVNPLSVAFGKIELQHPTNADTHVVLTEADLNRAFNSEFIQDKMKGLQITVDGKPTTVDTQQVTFRLPGDGKFALGSEIRLPETGETKQVAFTAVPQMAEGGRCIKLEQIEYADGQGLSPEMTDALVKHAQDLLDLRNFELEGMDLRLKGLDVQKGKLTLQAEAHVEQFPSS